MQTPTNIRPEHVPSECVINFDIYNPFKQNLSFHESWYALKRSGLPEVVWTPCNEGHWMVLSGRLVREVLEDSTRFSSHTVLVPKETAGKAYRFLPLSLDPPDHTPYRKLLDENLNPKAIRQLHEYIRALTVELIEGFRGQGRCNFVTDFAEQLPIRVFMGLVDLPMEDLPELKHLADQFTRPDGSMTYEDVTKAFQAYLGPVLDARQGRDGTDMLSRLINGSVNGRAVTEEEANDLCIQVLVGGLDTVVNLMSFVMQFLATRPDLKQQLSEDPRIIPQAVIEFSRRFGVVTTAREVIEDMDFERIKFKKGDMVVVPTMLHGLDDDTNSEPFEVQFDRRNRDHSTFGNGAHRCPGAHLAGAEMRIILEEWLQRIPDFELAPDSSINFTAGIVGSVQPFSLVWEVKDDS